MNILYFASTAFYRKPNPSFHLMHAMIEDLMNAGHEVYFVGPKLKGLDRNIPEEFEDNPKFHFSLFERPSKQTHNFAKRYLNCISYSLSARKHVKKYASICDVLFLQSSPGALYNVTIARLYMKRKPIIWNIQDMFPGSSIASGVMPQKWMQKVFFGLQKIAYRKSDIIVGISEDMRLKIREQGVPNEKIRVILNWYDDKSVHYVPWENNRFVNKYSMTHNEFYVQYAGTMGYVFDYKAVLNVAQHLLIRKDIVFQMIGAGSQKEQFIKEAEERGLTNIRFYPLEPQDMVSDLYSACDVCFIPLKHGVIGNSVPSKAGLLMACKKPIITSVDKGCEYANELNDNNIGIACPDDSDDAVCSAILNLLSDRKFCREMGERAYHYGNVLYSRTENMKKYLALFEEVCMNNK